MIIVLIAEMEREHLLSFAFGTVKVMGHATISAISRRWQVDRATARVALQRAEIYPSEIYASARYNWSEILRKIEAWPSSSVEQIDVAAQLETAEALAERLGVTPQTIRNYGRDGRLHRIEITPRSIRYSLYSARKNESEAKSGEEHKK
jgi:hypothetical protein